jgi:hypothetical protein
MPGMKPGMTDDRLEFLIRRIADDGEGAPVNDKPSP